MNVEVTPWDFGIQLLREMTEGRTENTDHRNDTSIFPHWFETGQDFKKIPVRTCAVTAGD